MPHPIGAPATAVVAAGVAADGADPMPLGVAWFLAVVLLVTAAALAWVGARAAAGRLDRNHLVGVRTPQTLRSDAAWSAAHRVAGPWLVGGAAVIAVPGLALLARPSNALGSLLVMAGTGLLVALVAVGCFLGHRAAAEE